MPLYPTIRVTEFTANTLDATILNTDFTLFTEKLSPVYDKGRKTEAEYRHPDTSALVTKKTFTDIVDVNGYLIGIDILIEWYDDTDTVLLTKTVNKPLNVAEAENVYSNRRIRAMDYLISAAIGTPVEPYVTAIFQHYEGAIRTWYDLGNTQVLGDLVNNETDTTILGYLDIETEPGWTVRDGIYYQIDYTPPA